MFLLRFVCLLGALLSCAPVLALDLYQGEAQVAGPDEGSRAGGVRQALQQVLVKVSGDRSALDNPAVAAALGNASSLMQRFEYREELVRDADGRPQARLFLIASFYPSSVDELLAQAGMNIWGRERPRVLVLIEDDGRLLDRSGAAALVERANNRGLSLRFSSESELGIVQQLASQGGNALSKHYGGGHVLYGVLGDAQYVLDNGHEQQRLHIATGAPQEQLSALADALQQALVSVQLRGGSDPEALQVWVEGVQSAGDYARVLSYLTRLTPVRKVQIAEVQADRLRLDMTVLGGSIRLQQTVEIGRLLDVRAASPLVLGLRAR